MEVSEPDPPRQPQEIEDLSDSFRDELEAALVIAYPELLLRLKRSNFAQSSTSAFSSSGPPLGPGSSPAARTAALMPRKCLYT
jgi:hypothetical protein